MQTASFFRLRQATLIAAFLLMLMSSRASATSITCGFGGASSDASCDSFDEGAGATFFFPNSVGPTYSLSLDFNTANGQLNGAFQVTAEDQQLPKSVLDATGQLPTGQGCLPFGQALENCVIFSVDAPGPGPLTWQGFYNVYIAWFVDLGKQFPGPTIRLDHARDDNPDFLDITIPGSFDAFDPFCPDGCEDASIGGTDDNFSRFAAAAQTVPEPASMTLIAVGLGAFWCQRRRANRV